MQLTLTPGFGRDNRRFFASPEMMTMAALYVVTVVLVASVTADSAQIGEDSSGNLVLDSRPGRERPSSPHS